MLRILGAIFIVLGLVIVGVEVFAWMGQGGEDPFSLKALGQWWFELSPDTIQTLQPAVERHVPGGPWLYENVIQPLLLWPVAIESLILGVVLSVIGRIRF